MDTSRSTDWSAEALLFSGRPNPAWALPDATGTALVARWEALAPASPPDTAPAPLGYRGVILRARGGRIWHAHAGVVEGHAGTVPEWRADPGRAWERALLATAPPALLPTLDF